MQTERPEAVGYRPPQTLEREKAGRVGVCQRCHRLKEYGVSSAVRVPYDELVGQLAHVREQSAVVLFVVDVFDAAGSFLPDFRKRVVGANPLVLVGNKVDVLPKGMREERVRIWLKGEAARAGLRTLQGVQLASGVTGHGVEALARRVMAMSNGRDVYVIGATNVGKSTLVNRLVRACGGVRPEITTSALHGTTLGLVSAPIKLAGGKRARLIDTPGVVHTQHMAAALDADEARAVAIRKKLRARFYRLVPGKSVYLGGLARLDYLGDSTSCVLAVFATAMLKIHPRATEGASDFEARQRGALLTPPSSPSRAAARPLDCLHELAIQIPHSGWERAAADIVIPGLGWVAIHGPPLTRQRFNVFTFSGITPSVRDPLMPHEYHFTRSRVGVQKHGKVKPRRQH